MESSGRSTRRHTNEREKGDGHRDNYPGGPQKRKRDREDGKGDQDLPLNLLRVTLMNLRDFVHRAPSSRCQIALIHLETIPGPFTIMPISLFWVMLEPLYTRLPVKIATQLP